MIFEHNINNPQIHIISQRIKPTNLHQKKFYNPRILLFGFHKTHQVLNPILNTDLAFLLLCSPNQLIHLSLSVEKNPKEKKVFLLFRFYFHFTYYYYFWKPHGTPRKHHSHVPLKLAPKKIWFSFFFFNFLGVKRPKYSYIDNSQKSKFPFLFSSFFFLTKWWALTVPRQKITRLTLYRNHYNKLTIIRILEDKDVLYGLYLSFTVRHAMICENMTPKPLY